MKNEIKQPCIFFESLLEADKCNDLKKKFISNFEQEFGTMNIKSINEQTGVIEIWNSYTDEFTKEVIAEILVYDFETYFNSEIEENFQTAKSRIDELILEVILNDKSPERFIDHQIILLNNLLVKTDTFYLDRPILRKSIKGLIKHLRKKKSSTTIDISAPNLVEIDDFSSYSFNWDSANPEDTIPNLEKFYSLLTAYPALIECSKEEFINAFTKRKVTNGIKWLVKGDNKLISKSSLLYFVSRLTEEGVINEIPSSFNKTIEYIFRDSSGELLKNIKQTKSTSSQNPAQKDRIDSIIDSLFS
ncbi:hypothetical protein [Flavobacterium sp. MDT1-60]|uniref:hypothetical protein n=1 Tax=Flavobacterium sp. MDT1-60 TaxID=1979344 RepID=UPI00177F61B2|nr:hypothetical protein [Flavobacterium sp. MDT1-60]QOG03493.1 hypothetical protein IHE43_04415 [Flavobacterium sp. MDT1-60]